ncbi:Putative auto-transporter adhesin, head GIN domain [Maribacter orientalis]|uniref:Putative auto-transporter adhesin, head GIN domain n=1 Tax=Maribacter orientalis TaxID=228957 RepID=A0A1H7UYB8_9FLAO|nr:head GIN domain-containing protein [Maribacter orientalis]SEM01961.1 Putative auto-transporter adhesin, head GIN domain [Maribacter orientalis]|tara:strand:- start:1939 stop:2664 length:726 start_codon:yes stop_codon:yes gene_type:complete
MKNLSVLLLTGLITLSCSAQWGKTIKGNGNNVTIERSTGDYDGIAVSGWFDVDLVSGNEGEITLQGEENLLEYIITEVKDGKLVIKTEKGVNLKSSNWKSEIRITVPVESISSVSMSGSGDIVGKTKIKSDKFSTAMSGSGDITLDIDSNLISASMSGSGDITLSGKTTDFDATVSGSGDIEAYNLEADNVSATVSGSADIQVTAKKSIKARVSGSGDISYRGNPEKVDTKTSGSGDISRG